MSNLIPYNDQTDRDAKALELFQMAFVGALALYMGRGNLVDNQGRRAPGIPVFELDGDEAPEQDGLYIRRITTRVEASVF